MFSRIQIILSDKELEALRTMAERDYRDLRSQVSFIVRSELEAQGLLDKPESVRTGDQLGRVYGPARTD